MSDVILLSGGIDSATLLADRAAAGTAALALGFHYLQRHSVELAHADVIARHYEVPFEVIDLASWGVRLAGCLTDPRTPVPDAPADDDQQTITIVPNRNAVMLMCAAGIAASRGHDAVLTAVHAGDQVVYPDCRPEFVDAINYAAQLGTGNAVTIEAPFANLSKTDIVRRAAQLEVPLLATWSCYEGGTLHCGCCGACRGRRSAFVTAGVPDPTGYVPGQAAA